MAERNLVWVAIKGRIFKMEFNSTQIISVGEASVINRYLQGSKNSICKIQNLTVFRLSRVQKDVTSLYCSYFLAWQKYFRTCSVLSLFYGVVAVIIPTPILVWALIRAS